MKPIEKGFSQFAIREIKGKEDNPEVLKYFDELGFDSQELKDETAWCSAFVNYCCKTTGYQYTGKLNARSWLEIGEATESPQLGDVVVLWRESKDSWKGHVGFYVCERYGYIYMLGGNQNDQVKVSAYPKSRLLEYRRLKGGL